jgi:uncharacterized protein with GYD domain
MSLYFLLGTLTERGQQMLRNNPDLPTEVLRGIDTDEAEVLGQYAVLGRYDFVMLVEADDNQAVAKLSLEMGVRVGLHIETLPALAVGVLSDDGQDEDVTAAEVAQGTPTSPEEWRIPQDAPDPPQNE